MPPQELSIESPLPFKYELFTVESSEWAEYTYPKTKMGYRVNEDETIVAILHPKYGEIQYFTQDAAINLTGESMPDNDEWELLLRTYSPGIVKALQEYPDPNIYKQLGLPLLGSMHGIHSFPENLDKKGAYWSRSKHA